ncbi:MAG TPA: hypothetical protein VHM70_03625 [Polyangiaceae bacterium]|jgi:hypothetical protein|nr:hypothetical protein [Polyangiaceae bacterium]
MKLNPWYLAALIAGTFLLTKGGYGAQLFVLGVTFAIFFGTLSLRRPSSGDATTTRPGL